MKASVYIPLAAVGLMPVLASILLTWLQKQGKLDSLSYIRKQILAGLLFGVIACCATEFGVPYRDTVINVRDSAPICAGLIFGPLAGIIAGTIGAIERWFSVYWGVGWFTRSGCTISTFLAGIIAAALRKYMFDDRPPSAVHVALITVVMEVIHMMMIFLTNLSNAKYAFRYVQKCTIPMVTVNAAVAAIAVYVTARMTQHPENTQDTDNERTISSLFHSRLLQIVLPTFLLTYGFTYSMQNKIARDDTIQKFEQTTNDVINDVRNKCDEDLQLMTEEIAWEITTSADPDLKEMKERFGVYEISVIGRYGVITDSSNDSLINREIGDIYGFPMLYIGLLDERSAGVYVSGLEAVRDDLDQNLKECVVRTEGVLVQVFLDETETSKLLGKRLPDAVLNRHIGENGGFAVFDKDMKLLCATSGLLYDTETETDAVLSIDINSMKEGVLDICMIGESEYYCMFTDAQDYYIVSILSIREADFSKELAVHLNFFLLTIIFGTMFVMIYITIKNLITGNIHKVNESLSMITAGNLDTVVDVRSAKEFIELSDDINSTVDTLKRYIAEANARIDTELRYAREIQSSALPSVFPDREEIDIYALMNPAREVGGDFYDFYFLDKDKLIFLVADVSGKGVPASLFMMRAKTILKTYAENRIAVADIFTNANYQLCDGNETSMFVTAWMGILNLKTGELKYANAGHNHPLIRRKDGKFEYLQEKSGFVLAGMEGIAYQEQSLVLEPGDEMFLYTDGVVEATNSQNELYGDGRLQNFLNEHIGEDAGTLCKNVRRDVDVFCDGAPQSDDITEFSMKFIRYYVSSSGKPA